MDNWKPDFVTETQETHLDNREFPLILKICFNPGLDLDELSEVGYAGISDYFDGISKYNKYDRKPNISIGWAGHTKNGSTNVS